MREMLSAFLTEVFMKTQRQLSAIADSSKLFSQVTNTQYANMPAYSAPTINREVELEKAIERLRVVVEENTIKQP